MPVIQAQFRMDNGKVLFEWTDAETVRKQGIEITPAILMILVQQGMGIIWSHFKLVPRG